MQTDLWAPHTRHLPGHSSNQLLIHLQLHVYFKDCSSDRHFSHVFQIRGWLEGMGKGTRVSRPPFVGLKCVCIKQVDCKSTSRSSLRERMRKRQKRRGAASTGSLFQFWENSWHTFPSKGLACQFNHSAYFGSHLIKTLVVLEEQHFSLDKGFVVHNHSSNCDSSSTSLPSS